MEGESGSEERQESELDHGIVENLVLAIAVFLAVPILELTSDGSVSCGDRDTACESATRLQDDR